MLTSLKVSVDGYKPTHWVKGEPSVGVIILFYRGGIISTRTLLGIRELVLVFTEKSLKKVQSHSAMERHVLLTIVLISGKISYSFFNPIHIMSNTLQCMS